MEQERFVVIDNKKGVVIPLSEQKAEALEETDADRLEKKVNKFYILIKTMIRQSIKDTIREYNLQLTQELKEYEKLENSRWENMEKKEEEKWEQMLKLEKERWDSFEKRDKEYKEKNRREEEKRWKDLENHFRMVDKSIREKQMVNKRKKGP